MITKFEFCSKGQNFKKEKDIFWKKNLLPPYGLCSLLIENLKYYAKLKSSKIFSLSCSSILGSNFSPIKEVSVREEGQTTEQKEL